MRLPTHETKDELDAWLLQVADTKEISLVACQLQGKPCRFLLDWIYRVVSRVSALESRC